MAGPLLGLVRDLVRLVLFASTGPKICGPIVRCPDHELDKNPVFFEKLAQISWRNWEYRYQNGPFSFLDEKWAILASLRYSNTLLICYNHFSYWNDSLKMGHFNTLLFDWKVFLNDLTLIIQLVVFSMDGQGTFLFWKKKAFSKNCAIKLSWLQQIKLLA